MTHEKLRIGLLHRGADTDWIWGEAIVAEQLRRSFVELGHDAVRVTIDDPSVDFGAIDIDVLISCTVPRHLIPAPLRFARAVYWWVNDFDYRGPDDLAASGFDGVAVNCRPGLDDMKSRGVAVRQIDLAASPELLGSAYTASYRSNSVYLGCYPHKRQDQMELLFEPARRGGDFALWGAGWENSVWKEHHRGVLPFDDIGKLYRSVDVVLGLTEERQMRRGMLNNRVFEALAAEAVVLYERFPALAEHEVAEFMLLASTPAEAEAALDRVHRKDPALRVMAREGRRLVHARHNWRSRASDFVRFFSELG